MNEDEAWKEYGSPDEAVRNSGWERTAEALPRLHSLLLYGDPILAEYLLSEHFKRVRLLSRPIFVLDLGLATTATIILVVTYPGTSKP